MTNIHKIAIIGGTGKSGKYLLSQVIKQNIPFKILLRDPAKLQISHPLMEIVKGDARDYEAIRKLVQGCDALISTLGQPQGEAPIFSEATRNVLRAMQEHGLNRYILTTGLNVDAPGDHKSPQTKSATDWMKTNYPHTTADKQVEFELLSKSNIRWTLVRLPMIIQTDTRNEIKISLHDCPGDQISATSLAFFLLGQLSDDTYAGRSPFIANA